MAMIAENNHPAIIPKDIFNRAKAEMARRASKRKVMQKRGKTEQGKYSARYALSELLVCGECGTPYKRCTWARNGKKRFVWRYVSRLEFGTKYCHNSPTLDEDRLHRAIVAALNEYGAVRQEVQESAMELAGMAQDYGVGGSDLLALRQRLDILTAEQTLLLDKVLEDMDNPDLNAQLKALAEEKQGILEQMAALQEKAERQALQASRRRELEEWLAYHRLFASFCAYAEIRQFLFGFTPPQLRSVLIILNCRIRISVGKRYFCELAQSLFQLIRTIIFAI